MGKGDQNVIPQKKKTYKLTQHKRSIPTTIYIN